MSKKPKMKLLGEDGNIYAVLGRAGRMLREAGLEGQVPEMIERVKASGNYYKALNIISEYVDTELTTKSKEKKARDAHER